MLTSNRLAYQLFTAQDLPLYLELATDAKVMKYITGNALSEEKAQARFLDQLEKCRQVPQTGLFAVRLLSTNTFIGLAKLVLLQEGVAEIGYSLLPPFWGKQYGSEIAGFLIHRAASLPNLRELVGIVDPKNSASIRILEKHGFVASETRAIDNLSVTVYTRTIG